MGWVAEEGRLALLLERRSRLVAQGGPGLEAVGWFRRVGGDGKGGSLPSASSGFRKQVHTAVAPCLW